MDILSSLNKNGSGINIRELTSGLVAADVEPKKALIKQKVTATETSISALGQIRAQLDKLRTAGDAINASPVLTASATGTAASVALTDRTKVVEQEASLYVNALAKRQVVEFTGYASADAPMGSGSIAVEIGVWTDIDSDSFIADPEKAVQTVNIPAGATLQDVANALNELDGVSARVLDKGDGTYSLGLVSETGVGSSLRLSAFEDAGQPGLAALDTRVGAAEHEVQSASDAILEVDGFVVLRSSNEIDDLIPGTSVTLNATGLTTISVARDKETAAKNLEYLVITVNETMGLLKDLTSRGVNGSERGALAGDVTGQAMITRLRNMMSSEINGHRETGVTLADVGIEIDRSGTYTFNRTKFDLAFDADPALFDTIFNDRLESSDPRVTVSGMPDTSGAFGEYEFSRPGGFGSATMGGRFAIGSPLEDGRTQFAALGGPLSGVTLIAENGVNSATISYARSFVSLMQSEMDDMLSAAGQIATRETQLADVLAERQEELTLVEDKGKVLEDRYLTSFTAMEVAVTQLKSTGEYLTNLIAQWNKSDN